MKKYVSLVLVGVSLAMNALMCAPANAQTDGSVTVNVTCQPIIGAQYDPDHVMVIWVQDGSGNFVKTLKVCANKRLGHLNAWEANCEAAGLRRDRTDAITGATISAPSVHNGIPWNCTDTNGNLVADGTYRVRVEMTSNNGTGPITSSTLLQFTKGTSPVTMAPADEGFFTGMSLVYTVNETPPVADDQSVSTAEDTARTITLTSDADPATYAIETQPVHGTLGAVSSSNVVYTPSANYAGLDSFTFKANDGADDSNIATVDITITTSSSNSVVPFYENFESDTVRLGDINGYHKWTASATATVQDQVSQEGSCALFMEHGDVQQTFEAASNDVVWAEFYLQPQLSPEAPASSNASVWGLYFDDAGQVVVSDGGWTTLTNHTPITTGEWVRVSIKMDYPAQKWLVCLNGQMIAENIDFAVVSSRIRRVKLVGTAYADAISVATNQPAGLTLDGDVIPDSWEQTIVDAKPSDAITNVLQVLESDDFDGDGFNNLEEYITGTDPVDANSRFMVISLHSIGPTNYISWLGSDNGATTPFLMERSTNASTWLMIDSSISRSSSGTNVWWDTAPPASGGVFYRPRAQW
jgi:hypothetical protein